jgi:nucleoside-diphosphate-sugar epimerase|tara:strand:- start:2871 stop:3845 length:975 start_codon:yes stop_codon:yes gene_type:complete
MKKKYLVTGGSGFIGSALVKRLLNEGHSVRVFDNNSRGNLRRLDDILDKIEFVEGDIRDYDQVNQACKGVDSICHLAFVNGTKFFYELPELVLEVGIKGMMNILDACKENNITDLILASSSEVYQSPQQVPTPEEVPLIVPDLLNPRYSYGGAKLITELLAINYGRNNFERVVIFRPHNVYGPDMGWEHVIPEFLLKMDNLAGNQPKEKIDFNIQGTGNETRAFIYIDDFTEGLIKIIDKGEHLNVYHIGTSDEIPLSQLAQTVARIFNVEINLIPGALAEGGTLRRCPDITKLRGLGFNPEISLENGLQISKDWYTENKHLKP